MAFSFSVSPVSSCIILLVVAAAAQLALALPQGPPVEQHFNNVCNLMTPLHRGNKARPGNGGFSIQTDLARNGRAGFNYTAGTTYTGDLESAGSGVKKCDNHVGVLVYKISGCMWPVWTYLGPQFKGALISLSESVSIYDISNGFPPKELNEDQAVEAWCKIYCSLSKKN